MGDSSDISAGRFRISPQAGAAILATLLFIAISIWWVLYDRRLPGGGDPGRHLSIALDFAHWLKRGEIGTLVDHGATWGDQFFYPPLVHLIGGIPAAFGLAVEDWGVIAVNLVFVPLLALGCYQTGKLLYGPTGGVLATVFALATPMILSLFHVFLLDAPLAAITAVTLWALLASERFERRRESVIAGALIGVGLLVKTPAPLFVAGPIAVMLVAGGWRQWRNLALLGTAAAVVAVPYYAVHLSELLDQSKQSTVSGVPGGNPFAAYDRFSLSNLAYYGWVGVNIQYLVPLLALLAAGVVAGLREIRTRRHLPELLAGLVVGYLGPTLLLSIRDPRYSLPLVVYVAVVATGWITTVRRRALAAAGVALLAGAVILNVAAQTTNKVPTKRIALPGHQTQSLDDPGAFTISDGRGYVVGWPQSNPLWYRLFDAAEQVGIKTARITIRNGPPWGTDVIGFDVLARQHGIADVASFPRPQRPDLVVNLWGDYAGAYETWVVDHGLAPPCGVIEEGAQQPPAIGAVPVNVSVARRVGDRYEPWCEF